MRGSSVFLFLSVVNNCIAVDNAPQPESCPDVVGASFSTLQLKNEALGQGESTTEGAIEDVGNNMLQNHAATSVSKPLRQPSFLSCCVERKQTPLGRTSEKDMSLTQVQMIHKIPGTGHVDIDTIKKDIPQELHQKCGASLSQYPSQVDLVMTWKFFQGDKAIKYALRSFEKHGLLDVVNNAYILVDNADVATIDRHSHPFNQSKIQVLTASDVLGADSWCDWSRPGNGTKSVFDHVQPSWCILQKLQLINGISPWVITVPDDVVLVTDFSMDALFDKAHSKPYGFSHGSCSNGQCLGGGSTAPLHGPNLLNVCMMKHVADVLNREWYYPREGQVFGSGDMMDAVCIATHALQESGMLADYFGYHSGPPKQKILFGECHTNGGCGSPKMLADNTLFWNVQGNGISAEYGKDSELHQKFTEWFSATYPQPSRFEKVVQILMRE